MRLSRKRRLLVAAASTAGVVGITVPVTWALADDAGPADAQTECEVKALPGPAGNKEGKVKAVSDSGDWMVGTADGKSVVWHGEEYTEIDGTAVDVNSEGVVVGYNTTDSGDRYAWVWQDGGLIAELASPLDYGGVSPAAINDKGQIAGNAGEVYEEEYLNFAPLFWESPDAEATELKLKSDATGEVYDITESGSALGQQAAEDAPWAMAWNADGSGQELPETETDENGYSAVPKRGTEGYALSTAGGPDGQHYLWTDGADPAATALTSSKDVDAEGRVYGNKTDEDQVLPAVAQGDEVTLLDTLSDSNGPDADNTVWSASADGSVMAGTSVSQDNAGVTRAVTWNCG